MTNDNFIQTFQKIKGYVPEKSRTPEEALFSLSKLEHVIQETKRDIQNGRNGQSK